MFFFKLILFLSYLNFATIFHISFGRLSLIDIQVGAGYVSNANDGTMCVFRLPNSSNITQLPYFIMNKTALKPKIIMTFYD